MTLVFYDGVCGLCNRLVRFLIRRDRRGLLKYAPLQGTTAQATLARHRLDSGDLNSVVVVLHWGTTHERTLTRSRAVLETLTVLGGRWRTLAAIGRLVPRVLADAMYRVVARSRYRIFGQFETCPIPPREWRDRFLE